MSVEFIGEENLQNGIKNVSEEIKNGQMLMRAASLIEIQAKVNATGRPGPMVQTGRLRASIASELLPSKMEAFVGTNVYYASFVEFGHRQTPGRFVPVLGRRLKASFVRAYPFMEPALEQVQGSGQMEGVFGQFYLDLERRWIAG